MDKMDKNDMLLITIATLCRRDGHPMADRLVNELDNNDSKRLGRAMMTGDLAHLSAEELQTLQTIWKLAP